MVLGLLLAEERGEPLMEVDQLLGRGADVVRCQREFGNLGGLRSLDLGFL
jgi:hypothetical protein